MTSSSQATSVEVVVSPGQVTLDTGAEFTFTVTVTGAGPSVTWSVDEAPAGGTITAGHYIAPTTPGTYHVRATSVEAPSASDRATVLVREPVHPPDGARVLYSSNRTHSPITPTVAQHLRAIAARGSGLRSNVFMKIGDSITASGYFFACFGRYDSNGREIKFMSDLTPEEQGQTWLIRIDLGGHTELRPTIEFFREGLVPTGGTVTAFDRSSLAARVGASASFPLAGDPKPFDQEFTAAQPQFAIIMYGSNDVGHYGTVDQKVLTYFRDLLALTDTAMARGVVPILSTMPPRPSGDYPATVRVFVATARAIAQGRQIPLVDYNREMMALGAAHNFGISGDNVHPSVADYNTLCWLTDTEDGLQKGYNLRNLVSLAALKRVKEVVVDQATAPDADAALQPGVGSSVDPFLVDALPFTDLRDVGGGPSSTLGSYAGCGDAPAAPGTEYIYKLQLAEQTSLRMFALPTTNDAVHLYLMGDTPTGASCQRHASAMIAATLPPGTYHVAVDGLVASPTTPAEFAFMIVECAPGESGCTP